MRKTIRQFYLDEVKPRKNTIFLSDHALIAILFSLLLSLIGDFLGFESLKKESVVSALFNYSSIAMGFCVTCVTMCLTMGDKEFVKHLCSHKTLENKSDSFSDLIFVFSWTAVCHWLSIIILVIATLNTNDNETLFSNSFNIAERISFLFSSAVIFYSLLQFLITIITTMQVGKVYSKFLKNHN